MVSSNTLISIFVAIFVILCFTASSSMAQSDFQQEELYQFLNSRYPNLYNRALRSNGKPTFIRFGKRSPLVQAPSYPFEQQQQQAQPQQAQQQWTA